MPSSLEASLGWLLTPISNPFYAGARIPGILSDFLAGRVLPIKCVCVRFAKWKGS